MEKVGQGVDTMEYRVVIPSAGRYERSLPTLELLPYNILKKTTLVVPYEELKKYRRSLGDFLNVVEIRGLKKKGIAEARHYSIRTLASLKEVDCIIMLDDDMYFYRRKDMSSPSLRVANFVEITDMINTMARYSMLKGYFACGLSARQGNNRVNTPFVENTRMMNAYALNVSAINNEGVRFNEMTVMEDFYVTLSMLTRGYKNRVIYNYCWDQRGSNDSGGCSSYRTKAVQSRAAHKLAKIFPDFVTVVKKKSNWKNMKERYDVRVQWKKAFASSLS